MIEITKAYIVPFMKVKFPWLLDIRDKKEKENQKIVKLYL